jgi:hypothetical protein
LAASRDDARPAGGNPRRDEIDISHLGFAMQQVQMSKRHSVAARRRPEDEQILPLDPRDADVVRAKRLMRATGTATVER